MHRCLTGNSKEGSRIVVFEYFDEIIDPFAGISTTNSGQPIPDPRLIEHGGKKLDFEGVLVYEGRVIRERGLGLEAYRLTRR